MSGPALSSPWAMLAALAVAIAAIPAAANDFALGAVTVPSSTPTLSDNLRGPFADHYTFTVPDGPAVGFSAAFDTGFWSIAYISDWAASLTRNGQFVESGQVSTVWMPEGWPDDRVDFASRYLAPGDYTIQISGIEHGIKSPFISMSYRGSIDIATSAVPEPASAALWLAGLAGLGGLAGVRRRSLTA